MFLQDTCRMCPLLKGRNHMAWMKCPRCGLNYIREDDGMCKACKQDLQGESSYDEIEMCSVCGMMPALPGKGMCLSCLQEEHADEEPADEYEREPDDDALSDGSIDDDPISGMDEIIPDTMGDIPAQEFSEISEGLSLEAVGEEEEKAENEDDEEESI